MVRQQQDMFWGGRRSAVDLGATPDWVALAAAFGVAATRSSGRRRRGRDRRHARRARPGAAARARSSATPTACRCSGPAAPRAGDDQRGGIRSAPSNRMTSPFSIGFSTMWAARSPYSSGRPSRCGCGTCSPSAVARLLGQAGQQRRVEQAGGDGDHADAGLREVARGRQRHADDAALGGRVGELADLAVERGDRGGVDADPALALLVGLVGQHRRRRQAQHVEGADQVHADDGLERVERVRPAPAGRLLRPADAGAADRDPQRPGGLDRGARPARRPSRRTRRSARRAPRRAPRPSRR